MSDFLDYFRSFFRTVHTGLLIFCICYASLLIFLNYRFGIETRILASISSRVLKFAGFYLVYFLAFAIPYLFAAIFTGKDLFHQKAFWLLVLLAPAIFALKVNFIDVMVWMREHIGGDKGRFWGIILNLPSRLLVVSLCLFTVWRLGNYSTPVFGFTAQGIKWQPYLLMLAIMIPLVAWASTQPDFLRSYPKMKALEFLGNERKPWQNLLYELAYGMDFISIEWFFRGFLVLAFMRFAGQESILPMAVFYCSIHFGKPLMECVSSLFGGIILGVVVYRTGSIAGGLVVHLGIAWMMEAGGYLGRMFLKSNT